jgi:drug/metabolite transporter (DMT)-like permease
MRQITMQLKILVSALFSIALFGRVLPPYKWKGLVILTIGCAFVNLDQVRMRV